MKKILMVCSAVLMAVCVPIQMMNGVAYADQYDDQMNAIQQEIIQYQAEATRLRGEAKTLQSAIAILAAEKAQMQAQLDISQAKYDQLVAQIADTEKKIKDNQDALGVTIANLYVDDNITPVEMLFGSSNISDYMDKQEYRNSVRNELTSTISRIKDLKTKLESQKTEVERVLVDQRAQRDAVATKENERLVLLDQTNGQESAYQELSAASQARINSLRAQQAAELAARASSQGGGYTSSAGDGSRGGYPVKWLDQGLDYYTDDWGMLSRECVSYAAFKVDQAYGNMPHWGKLLIGNAWQWAFSGWLGFDGTHASSDQGMGYHQSNAERYGIPTGTIPKAGSVGVLYGAYYGHVVWVDSVNSDGTINISQFNNNWSGDYSEWKNLSPTYFDKYIYFGEW
ncbi:MAG: CHAP domain-containing protein [Candidatus Saccharibacteria bacterium]